MIKSLFTFISFLSASLLFSQTAIIRGTITDTESGEKLIGATILADKNYGTVSDAKGNFVLQLGAGKHTLRITFLGYKSEKKEITITAGEELELPIKLKNNDQQLGVVVVSGSQYNKNTTREVISIDVIRPDLVRNTNSKDLGEAISRTPGVLVQDGQVTIRGGSSYSYGIGGRVAILEDGIPLMSVDLGEGQIKMANIQNAKQIEVVKGASSASYGSSALNGAVNLITAWPTSDTPTTSMDANFGVFFNPPTTLNKWWDGGQPAFAVLNAVHERSHKTYQGIYGGNMTYGKSFLQNNDEFRFQAFVKNRIVSKKRPGLNYGVNGSFQYERSDRFFLSKDLDSNALFCSTYSGDRYARTNIDPFLNYSTLTGHSYRLKARYLHIQRFGNGADEDAVGHSLFLENQYQYRYKNLINITTGVPILVGLNRSNLYRELHLSLMAAFFVQAEVNWKWLSVLGGMRYEINQIDQNIEYSKPVFRTGINIKAAKGTFFRGSWGQGYRVPTIAERYIAQSFFAIDQPDPIKDINVLVVPNDTLRVETGWNMELGIKQVFKISDWKGYVDLAFYWMENKDLIEYRLGFYPNAWGDGRPIFAPDKELFPGTILGLRPNNVEFSRVAGYELSAGATGNIGKVELNVLAGYNYSYPVQLNDSTSIKNPGVYLQRFFTDHFKTLEGTDGQRILQYRLRHLFKADVELAYRRFRVGATLQYFSYPEFIDPQFYVIFNKLDGDKNTLGTYLSKHKKGDFVCDVRLAYQIKDNIRIGVILKNLTNRHYMLRPGKIEPLRNFTLQFQYRF